MRLHCPVCGNVFNMDKGSITNVTPLNIYFSVQACKYCTDEIIDRLTKHLDDVLNGFEEDSE